MLIDWGNDTDQQDDQENDGDHEDRFDATSIIPGQPKHRGNEQTSSSDYIHRAEDEVLMASALETVGEVDMAQPDQSDTAANGAITIGAQQHLVQRLPK